VKERSIRTIKANGSDLKIYWDFLNKYSYTYDNVTPKVITKFIDFLRNGDTDVIALHKESIRTNKTINRILSTVHCFYQFCANMNEIDNPIIMHNTIRPSNMFRDFLYHARKSNKTQQSIFHLKESSPVYNILPENDANIVMNSITRRRDKIIFDILYYSGARIQEVLDLQIESIPVPDSSQSIGLIQGIKSKGKYRDLYMPMFVIEEIDDFIFQVRSKIKTDHSYIFVSEQKQNYGRRLKYKAVYDVFKRIQRISGINFKFHDLRHTLCTNLLEFGIDISIVQIILGHENLHTTQKYAHLSDIHLRNSLGRYWMKKESEVIERQLP
jgi:site-specific recombinase XerD